jgi:polyhydroxybutyrate depolymerase
MVRVLLLLVALLAACSAPPATTPTDVPDIRPKPAPGPVQTFTWDGMERTYLVHLPAGFDESREYPLLLVLHGAFGSGSTFEKETGFSELADERGFIVVYGDGTEWGPRHARVWNAGNCCGDASEPLQDLDDVGYAKEVVDQMSTFYRINPDRVFVAGMSNGGMMANRLACDASNVFRGIAAVAGTIQVTGCRPIEKLRVLHVHGTADNTVPYGGGPSGVLPMVVTVPVDQAVANWAQREGCDAGPITTSDGNVDQVAYQGCDQPVELLRINGGGHIWPPGAARKITDFFQL